MKYSAQVIQNGHIMSKTVDGSTKATMLLETAAASGGNKKALDWTIVRSKSGKVLIKFAFFKDAMLSVVPVKEEKVK